MEYDVMWDLTSFIISVFSGFFMGIIFDFYRTIRRISKSKGMLSNVGDLIFWIIAGVLFFFLLVNTTGGVLRGFVFIGALCGIAIYMYLFSKRILSLFSSLFQLILELFSEIIGIIEKPFVKIRSLIKAYFKEMIRYSKMIFKKK